MDSIDLKAVCNVCGKELDAEVKYKTFEVELIIEPCEICIDSASSSCYDEGYDDGKAEAKSEAKTEEKAADS